MNCFPFTSTRVHLPVFIGFVLFNLHEHTSSSPGVYWIRLVQSSRAHEFTSRCLLDSSCSIFTSTRVHLPVFIGFVLFNLQFSVYSVVDNCLNFCPFFLSFDYCIVCPSLIKYFWLSLWYLHTFVKALWSFSDDQCKIRMPKALREIVVLIFASTLMNMQKWWQRSDKSSDILARNIKAKIWEDVWYSSAHTSVCIKSTCNVLSLLGIYTTNAEELCTWWWDLVKETTWIANAPDW
jgi:hypothetical protein